MSTECQLCSNDWMPVVILIFNIIFKWELSLFINKDAEASKTKEFSGVTQIINEEGGGSIHRTLKFMLFATL